MAILAMTIQRDKFPFKWILKILAVLQEKEYCTNSQVAKAIGSCVSDAGEVLRMMNYLTHFGKIVANPENKWKFMYTQDNIKPPSKNFRTEYIQNLIEIIDLLKEGPQSTQEIADRTSQEIDDIQELLSFLTIVTGNGHVCLKGEGYPREWTLRSWF